MLQKNYTSRRAHLFMIIQIYEIQTPWEAEKCLELGVDHLGSVILSPQHCQDQEIRTLIRITHEAGKKNSLIFLFDNEDTLYKAIDYYQPDIIHFCESLTDHRGIPIDPEPLVERQERIKRRFPELTIMRSIPIAPTGRSPVVPSLSIARSFEAVSDMFLTDTWLGHEPVGGYIGITGRTLDWDVAARLVEQTHLPVILAGGLSPENVFEAIVKVKPAGADSCTRTNQLNRHGKPIRFKKDFKRVREFVQEVRRAEAVLGRGPQSAHIEKPGDH
ncbi:MAG: hypothetical protein DRG63_10550 [Deltaproteobacteria bacterium]|nr:MAG: hypothetical protein DRG63_10550 [Deltaproteobacteria bacterium]